jgi:type I restriction-modification system DNA methylase subunit
MLDVSTLEGWLWDAARQIRGPQDAPKFKDYILPLISLKRLSDVFEDELDRLADEFGDREVAATLVAEDHGLVRFYVPPAALWPEIARRTTGLGEYLTDAVRAVGRENPRMLGVIDMVDFNATAAGQHMAASLGDAGRMAVVLDTGAVSRGSGNTGSNRERDIRKLFVEGDLTQPGDLIETIVLLPENLFYNTSAPGIVMVVNRRKRKPGEILLINASRLFAKGRPKNYLEEQHIARVAELYHAWEPVDGLAAVITTAEAARNDYNLSPSRSVSTGEQDEVLPLEEAMVLLREAEEERAAADEELERVLVDLGLGGFRRG